jgi:hypothetical protein
MREVCFAWVNADGGVSITHPNWRAKKPSETDDQFLERIARNMINPVALHPNDLPRDRANRNAWRLRDGKVVVESVPTT